MPLTSHNAQNLHRVYILGSPTSGASMGSDQTSDLIDFKNMTTGSIQVKWEDQDADDGEIAIEVSNIPEEEWFDEIHQCPAIMSETGSGRGNKQVKLFDLGNSMIGFRYARVKFYHGSNTTGTITAIALGKKNG